MTTDKTRDELFAEYFEDREGSAKVAEHAYRQGWKDRATYTVVPSTTPSPISALLHRLNDATKPVDAADRNLIIRALSTAPTQGADARPVAITDDVLYKVWALALDSTEHEFKAAAPALLATRDAALSDGPETPWSKVMELAQHHGVWIDQYGWIFGNDDAVHAFAQAIAAIAPRDKT